MTPVLTGNYPDEAKRFVADHFRHVSVFSPSALALSWVCEFGDRVELVGGVVMEPRGGGFDAELSIALAEGFHRVDWQEDLCTLFGIAFRQLGLARLTCHVARKNRRARRFVERLGFAHEGTMPRGYDGTQAALIYGMTAENCRWL